jgi:hypothetical protein
MRPSVVGHKNNRHGWVRLCTTTFPPRGRFRVEQGRDSTRITLRTQGPNCRK